LTYQSAFVDDAGKLQTRRDLYNLDSRTLNAIKNARASAVAAPDSKSERAPAAPAQRRQAIRRVDQNAAAQPSMFFGVGTQSAQPQRGAYGR
jgi:hypothetical protein